MSTVIQNGAWFARSGVKSRLEARVEALEERRLCSLTIPYPQSIGQLDRAAATIVPFDGKLGYFDLTRETAGDRHLYKLTLPSSGSIAVDPDNQAAVAIYNKTGNLIAHGNNDVNQTFSRGNVWKWIPGGGDVYVYAYTTAPGYDFMAVVADVAGDKPSLARNLGTFSGTRVVADTIGTWENDVFTDDADYFKFATKAAGNVIVNVGTPQRQQTLTLVRDANNNGKRDVGETLATATADANGTLKISKSLPAGTYFAAVGQDPTDFGTEYTISVTAPAPTPAPAVSYGSRPTARNVGAIAAVASFTGSATSADPEDYFKFTVTPTKTVSVKLDRLAADFDLELQNESGAKLVVSSGTGTAAEQIERFTSVGGTFFARVLRIGGEGSYRLTLAAA